MKRMPGGNNKGGATRTHEETEPGDKKKRQNSVTENNKVRKQMPVREKCARILYRDQSFVFSSQYPDDYFPEWRKHLLPQHFLPLRRHRPLFSTAATWDNDAPGVRSLRVLLCLWISAMM